MKSILRNISTIHIYRVDNKYANIDIQGNGGDRLILYILPTCGLSLHDHNFISLI